MKAIVLAAGEGTRLRPLTYTRSKAMIPIANKPLLEYVLESLKNAGIKEVTIVVGYRSDLIMKYFKDGSDFGLKITYVEQTRRLGTANAVYMAKELFENEDRFIVTNGDIILDKNYISEFLNDASKFDSPCVISTTTVDDPSPYGEIVVENNRVKKIVEKPTKRISNIINAGVYLFTADIFKAVERTKLSKRSEYELTDSIRLLMRKNPVYAITTNKRWIDVGKPWDVLKANEEILKDLKGEIKGEVEDGVTIHGEVFVDEGTIIRRGAYIVGPVMIGKNCIIGPNCFIRPSTTLGDHVIIGNAVEIKNSVIMRNTNVCHLAYVGDSVIGEHCNFGAGTIAANLRHDNQTIKMKIKGELVDSKRRKLGVIMGDYSKTGVNVSINPGKKIGPYSLVGPGVIIYSDVEPHTMVLKVQELRERSV